ncbi:MAG: hypothetical protein ACYSWO_26150 [Planctomycetota bacterium]
MVKFKEIGATGVKVAALKISDLRIDMKDCFNVSVRPEIKSIGLICVQEGDDLDLDPRYVVIDRDVERYLQGIALGQQEFACELI